MNVPAGGDCNRGSLYDKTGVAPNRPVGVPDPGDYAHLHRHVRFRIICNVARTRKSSGHLACNECIGIPRLVWITMR
jgi:hypothetical protein